MEPITAPEKEQLEPAFDSFNWQFDSLKECIVCGSPDFAVHYQSERRGVPLAFSRCQRCDVVFQNPRLTLECLKYFFSSEFFFGKSGDAPAKDAVGYYDYGAWENCYKMNSDAILRSIQKYVPPPAQLLEVGPATGWFLNAARKMGYEVTGNDISEELASRVYKLYGIRVEISSIEQCNVDRKKYDVICNFGGIACWYNPHKAFHNIHALLNKNGVFCFNYIDYHNPVARMRGKHYFEFNHASLAIYTVKPIHRLLEESGFKIISEKTQWQYASFRRILSYLKMDRPYRLFEKLKLLDTVILIPAIGTRLVIAAKDESGGQIGGKR